MTTHELPLIPQSQKPLMTFQTVTSPIPYDVVGAIVEQLRGDKITLQSCTLVSHSFHLLSRPRLFSTIILQTSMESQRLCHLLEVNPVIARMIKELFVEYSDVDLILTSERLSLNDPYLPTALHFMPSLYRLSFHSAAAPGWYNLSPELRSAIAFHSRSLIDVRFSSFCLPISALANFSKLRSLSLHDIYLHTDDEEPQSPVSLPILAQLEALELGVANPYHRMLAPCVFSQMRNLKLLSISSGVQCGLPLDLEWMHASAGSIETLLWCGQMSNPKLYALISLLDVLHNLRSLVLLFQCDHQCQSTWLLDSHLTSLVSYFVESASSEDLEDLTIGFHPFSGTDWGDEVVDISTGHGWGDLDAAVSRRCPALKRFQIFFRGDSNYLMDAAVKHLQDAMRIHLPSLSERGVLSVGIASISKVRDDACWRAGF